MKTAEIVIPEISDEILAERLGRIRFLKQAMLGLDGKPYTTEEQDKNLFDLFYVESNVNPREQAFNFDENSKMTARADGLVELDKVDIFVKIGGYYGFCKITMAEVLSQIPEAIVNNVVAFALDPETSPQIINEDYQSAKIIFYGKTDQSSTDENLPSSVGLIKPVDKKKAKRLKDRVRPIINYKDEGYMFVAPGNINKPFMDVGIWLRVNGSNLHRTNPETKVTDPCKKGEKISVYNTFTRGADFFEPTYAHTISQIPDELITEKTIGLLYHSTDYFKTKEGVVHKTEYTLIEKI
jgi:hypothetical protein